MGFPFCYVESDSLLAFLNGGYSQAKDIVKKLEKYYGFSWTEDPAIIGASKSDLESNEISEREKKRLRDRLYKRDGKRCHYCSIREEDFIRIWGRFYKARGKRLELERVDNEKGYTEENCVLSCAICNNAKSDKFTYEEFKKVGRAIKEVWLLRKKD